MKWLFNLVSAHPIPLLVLAFLFVLWILLSPRVSPGLYTQKLFLPESNHGDTVKLKSYVKYPNKRVSFKSADGKNMMRGWIFNNPSSKFVYLFHQGNSGDIPRYLELVELLLESGASVFIYEPRGYGKSFGKPTVDNWLEDGLTAYDFLVDSLNYTSDRIIILGVSLGTTAASHVSKHRAAAGMVLQSGFASLEKIAKKEVPFLKIYPSWLFTHKLDNMRAVSAPSHPPILFVHGLQDDLIPPAHTREMYFAATEKKSVLYLPNSNHTEVAPVDREKYLHTLMLFLAGL